jgi:hypothetical protein
MTSLPMRVREIANVPYRGPRPKLPRGLAPETKRYWDVITRLPHASIWTDADWEVALIAARLHSRFVRTGTGANELRAREAALGVSAIDRAKLRIAYVDPKTGRRELVAFFKPPPQPERREPVEPPPPPDKDVDPVGWQRYLQERLAAQNRERRRYYESIEQGKR